jgi:hypothetical protein
MGDAMGDKPLAAKSILLLRGGRQMAISAQILSKEGVA